METIGPLDRDPEEKQAVRNGFERCSNEELTDSFTGLIDEIEIRKQSSGYELMVAMMKNKASLIIEILQERGYNLVQKLIDKL